MDWLPKRVARGWRQVGDAVRGRFEPSVVARQIEKAMARTLRAAGGVPWVHQMGDALGQSWRDGSSDAIESLVARLDPADCGTARGVFVDAARSLSAEGPYRQPGMLVPEADPDRSLAVEGLRRMPDRLCFGGIEPKLIGDTFANSAEFCDYRESCLREVRFDKVAIQLLDGRDPSKITAPRSSGHRKTTKELLHGSVD